MPDSAVNDNAERLFPGVDFPRQAHDNGTMQQDEATSSIQQQPVRVVVHTAAHAAAALRAAAETGCPVELVSAPSAAAYQGPRWLWTVCRAAAEKEPATDWSFVLDCGEAPGLALAALDARVPAVVLRNVPDTILNNVAAIAAGYGARLLPVSEPSLDLADVADPLPACRTLMEPPSQAM